ncbi:MAG: methylenetetrahydrofolate reductase [NAD(P)H] [Gammaproteobacteria bacterium]|nr:methylenetetrahydrofolate reductase [NAD(P)H] [Gammaproteobacteria bacterium]
MNSQKKFNKVFSIEFFPPKTEQGAENLRNTRKELADLNPAYISVTFGAGGSTQDGTIETVTEIQESGISAAPHLSCITSSKAQLRDILNLYQSRGITRIVALRGDMPSGTGAAAGELRYANELVEFIRQETGDHFKIEVAAYPEVHPQAESASADLKNFKRKVDAGANSAITQYFYNPDAFYRFVDDCEKMGIDIPIIPGIMPITNYKQLARFSDACGAEIPRWIRKKLEDFGDDIDSIKAFGIDVTIKLCENLLSQGTAGLHFYSMNKTEPTRTIWQALDLKNE